MGELSLFPGILQSKVLRNYKVNCFHESSFMFECEFPHRIPIDISFELCRCGFIYLTKLFCRLHSQIWGQGIASTNYETINFIAFIVGRKEKGRRSCCQTRVGSFFNFFSRFSVVKACSSRLRGFESICNFCF